MTIAVIAVGIALGYRLDDQGSRVQFLVGAGNFSLHHHIHYILTDIHNGKFGDKFHVPTLFILNTQSLLVASQLYLHNKE
jgi:hypothetical protein